MKTIPLTKGLVAIVDDEDFEFLSRWSWHAFEGCSGNVYAARNSAPDANGRRKHIFMHRVIADTPEGAETDHRNGNGLDNRRSNLRHADRMRNMWNRAPNRSGSSRHKGVYWHAQHRKWCASIQAGKRRRHLGLFQSEEAAAAAYAHAAAETFGEFNRSV
jgi:hypothetical protein